MTADNVALAAMAAVAVGWMWLWRREARRADHYHRMLHNVLDMLERRGAVHVHRRCACQAHWVMDGETVAAGGLLHGQHSCQPEAEVIP